ncbi:MAG: DUF1801 domain-containing protein [Saprospiraceae bacterium]
MLTPQIYIDNLPEERIPFMQKLRETILNNIPQGFEETIQYKMISYVVPHTLYPSGYHCDPKLPLPFVSIASQKNYISLYHMGMYADNSLLNWFVKEFNELKTQKLDMGKSCIRFKKPELLPLDLIGKLMQKMTPQDWIAVYEDAFKKS